MATKRDFSKYSVDDLDKVWSKLEDGNPLKKQVEQEIESRVDKEHEAEEVEKSISNEIEKAFAILGLKKKKLLS